MSTEFSRLNILGTEEDNTRLTAVEAALVLVNTCISASDKPSRVVSNIITNDVISELADSIEKAFKLDK
jgi:hypothetical protein